MKKNKLITSVIALVLGIGLTEVALGEEPPTAEQMWKIIQQQQKTIEELKAKLENTDQNVVATKEKVDANAEAVEEVKASDGSLLGENTTIGGYGELHYNNLDGEDAIVDLHRFVLFFGHEFTDDFRFASELEVEHAVSSSDDPGEVEIEQAFIEYDLNAENHLRAGLYLVPTGILNETHEPPTFYGVERNMVEKKIIPVTWREGGIGLNGDIVPGWKYDVMLSSGLGTSVNESYDIRSGHGEAAKAPGEDGAITARIRYTGIPGLELALSGQHQMDLTQGAEDISANLLEAHVDYLHNGFGLRALYASWWLDDGPAFTGPAAIGADRQDGFYIEPSYKFRVPRGEAGFFARYEQWNNMAGSQGGADSDQTVVGLNYWPIDDVVFKFDYQFQNEAAGDHDGLNLGVGYQF